MNIEIEKSSKQSEFIRLFNELHKFLQTELYVDFMKTKRGKEKKHNNPMTFEECLYTIKQRYRYTVLNNYIDQLYLINNFRNTIVHESTNEFYDIAEPSDYTMNILKEVYNFFLNPITIKNYLNSKKVNSPLTVSSEYNLVKILNLISEYEFSQFPIFDDEFSGMITDNGLINFIAKLRDEGGIIFEDNKVKDIIKDDNDYEENKESYSILYQEKELYRVLDVFTDVENVTKYVLISKSGKEVFRSKEDLVGIFTTADILDVVKYIKEN